jgi:integrase
VDVWIGRWREDVIEKLNIPKCGLHAFRHMHSSLLLETGTSPTVTQAQLRHSDARITLGVYGHVIGDSQRNAVEKVVNWKPRTALATVPVDPAIPQNFQS